MKKFAFTLAESLITLTILGVVASLSIPTLVSSYKNKQNSVRLEHTYSTLRHVISNAVANGAPARVKSSDNLTQMNKWYEKMIVPYVNVYRKCSDTEQGCWPLVTFKPDGSKFRADGTCGSKTVSFVLPEGSYVCLDDYSKSDIKNNFGVEDVTSDRAVVLFYDVNGNGRPNTFGQDIFISIFNGEKLIPAGKDKSFEDVNSNCTKSGNGYMCMQKAIDSGYKFPLY